MILSDGTTTLTFSITDDMSPDSIIDSTSVYSAGGRLKSQVTGERFVKKELVRVNGTELRSLLDLLQSGADEYFYTPTTTPPEYQASDFPINVWLTYKGKKTKAYNTEIIYYVEIEIKSVEYI